MANQNPKKNPQKELRAEELIAARKPGSSERNGNRRYSAR